MQHALYLAGMLTENHFIAQPVNILNYFFDAELLLKARYLFYSMVSVLPRILPNSSIKQSKFLFHLFGISDLIFQTY